jgi:segregation and condensation protein B
MELKSVIEALLFSSQKPLSPAEVRDVLSRTAAESEEPGPRELKKVRLELLETTLQELAEELERLGRPSRLVCVAGSWQLVTRPEYAPWLRVLLGVRTRPPRLSQAGLETLAIVAYRQPLTRAEIEQIRGVSVDGVMQTLLERGLVEVVGRADAPGRPQTYGTTSGFLEYFGLRRLDDLPAADELRRLPVERPESLLTVDPGLATAPPPELAAAEPEPDPPPKPAAPPQTVPPSLPPTAGQPEPGRTAAVVGAVAPEESKS